MTDTPRPPKFADALGWPLIHAGKVRELYAVPGRDDAVLMVATDAISAFDYILDAEIPGKGKILTQLSWWWFEQLADIVDNHVLSTEAPDVVDGRATLVEKLDMVPIECVARGYLTGSAWAEYKATGTACGVPLPDGLHDGAKLPEPIFTPAMKAEFGEHDENVDFATMCATTGDELGAKLRDTTLALYSAAEQIARERGIILADTKFEFGLRADGALVLADEVLTPDSSRFWDATAWQVGALTSFDKQYVRNWLTNESGWQPSSGEAPPTLPQRIIDATADRYRDAFARLTGSAFVDEAETIETDESDRLSPMARVVVDVMPKPEILDPQGKAVTGALKRLGYEGLTVRQGKRFEIETDGEWTDEKFAQIEDAAEKLLANTVIETYTIYVDDEFDDDCCGDEGCHCDDAESTDGWVVGVED